MLNEHLSQFDSGADAAALAAIDAPLLVCVLGSFTLLKGGRSIAVQGGGKAESLLSTLALQTRQGVRREVVLSTLWPDRDTSLAGQALNTLVYGINRLLGDEMGGAAPVQHVRGYYQLNVDAGVTVDVMHFDALASAAAQAGRIGQWDAAMDYSRRAVELYRGDLCTSIDFHAVIERERLRARYLGLLSSLADHSFQERDYARGLVYALRMLEHDPFREDAHRLVMRCHARLGERSQALRQYRVCEDLLRREFEAPPEPATTALYHQLRLQPETV